MNPTQEAEHWESEIPWMTKAWADPASLSDATLEFIEAALAPAMRVPRASVRALDLGCGAGRFTFPFARIHHEAQVFGLDSCVGMLRQARIRRAGQRPTFLLGDGRTIPKPIAGLSAAWSVTVFQHLAAEVCAGYVTQVADRLLPGGRFVYQYVVDEGQPEAPFSVPHAEEVAESWAHDAGLTVLAHEQAVFQQWRWVVAQK